jgi:hypothetical protein
MVAAATLTEMVGALRHRRRPHGTYIGSASCDGDDQRTFP